MEFKIYVINATEYGESGKEHGVWLNLPMTCNELDATLEKIGVSATDNYIIMDAELNLPFTYEIGEYTSLEYLNSLANNLAEIELKGDLDWVAAYIEATGYSLEYTIDNYEDNSEFFAGMTLREVAEEFADETAELSEFARRYFDYDAFANDLRIDGYVEYDGGVLYVY